MRPEFEGLDREEVRKWYNGYNWEGGGRVYNPFDILLLCRNHIFKAWWFETGTPTFVWRRSASTSASRTLPRRGGVDLALRCGGRVHLFEFKVVERAGEGSALRQLTERGYADKYRASGEPRPSDRRGVQRRIAQYHRLRHKQGLNLPSGAGSPVEILRLRAE